MASVGTLRLSTLLPLALALLVVAAAVPTILVGFTLSSRATDRLVLQRAETVMDGMEAEVERLLEPVVAQLAYARLAVAEGIVTPEDTENLRAFALGLLAGTPQVFGVGWVRPDGSMRRWERGTFREIEEPLERLPFTRQAVADARAGKVAVWAEPFVSEALGDVILNYRVAVERGEDMLGLFAIGVTGAGLSRYAEEVSERYGVTAFVLSGDDRLIAYPGRTAMIPEAGVTEPPHVETSSNPVVAGIWQARLGPVDAGSGTGAHLSRIDGELYAYFIRELPGYAPRPLTIVVASPLSATAFERRSPYLAAGIGLVLTAIAAGAAWMLGRHLAQPVGRLDAALGSMSALDFAGARQHQLGHSRVREWRSIAERVEDTSATLEKLSTYVPQALTRRLLSLPGRAAAPEERDVTILFMDMEGFTHFAAGRSAPATAAHLSRIFAIAGPMIERHGGVIDKYTGDGLMAFWGAPEAQSDHAARALRTAAELTRVLPAVIAGGPRVRIGLHAGPAVVGDIGFPGRVDYTLTGDTVNVAQRIEAAVRGLHPSDPVIVGASQAVLDRAGMSAAATGTTLRGAPVAAYVLDLGVLPFAEASA